jgi:hypothetical protein
LERRVDTLEQRVVAGDDSAWPELRETAIALAQVAGQAAPGMNGDFLTTAEMAERLSIAPKTLLKRARRGEIRPALKKGKLLRWRGDEAGAR